MSRYSRSWNGRIKRNAFAALIAGTTLIPGCKIPEICRPESMRPLPQTFDRNNDPAQGMVSDQNSACLGWREFFNDPTLHQLIADSLAGNQELKILAQDIRIANNEYRARRGLLFPFTSIGTSAGIEKSSRFTRDGAVEDQLQAAPGKGFPSPSPIS